MLCTFCHESVAMLYSYPQVYCIHQWWHGYQFWKRHAGIPCLLCWHCLPVSSRP